MKPELRLRILDTIRQHRMLDAGDRVGVAVSGGADSVGLLCAMDELRDELGIGLCVLHLNHALRGAASDADENFVAGLVRARSLEFLSARENVTAMAKRNHWNLEDAGRRARNQFFEQAMSEGRCTKVAVGHTADDQAETVLARIVHGTGPRGLGGIYPVRGNVVRPLINVRRGEIREYLTSKRQSWREDATNLDTTRLRARVRHKLLPTLESDFNPAIVDRLASLSAIFRDEEAFWNLLVDDRIRALAREIPGGYAIAVSGLLAHQGVHSSNDAANRAISRRVVQSLFAKVAGGSSGLEFGHVEEILNLAAQSQSGRRLQLPHGVDVSRSFDQLEFTLRSVPESTIAEGTFSGKLRPYEYAVALVGRGAASIDVPELGLRFCLKDVDWPQTESDTICETGALDADRLTPPLVLRNWRPGDAYRLPGKRQAQKLKRLFSDARVGIPERKTWPVLTSAGRIAWTRGWPPAAEFLAGKKARRRVVVVEEKL